MGSFIRMEDQSQYGDMSSDARIGEHSLADIAQLFVYKVEPQLAFLALSQDVHLARWWCEECKAEARPGGHVRLFFESNLCVFEVTDFVSYQFIEWKCTDARTGVVTREDWLGSLVSFQISRNDSRGTDLHLSHRALGSPTAREEWVRTWNRYLGGSLTSYLESGVGQPASR
jgi:uncharacterized protein YndB with AHSA1/START domain